MSSTTVIIPVFLSITTTAHVLLQPSTVKLRFNPKHVLVGVLMLNCAYKVLSYLT